MTEQMPKIYTDPSQSKTALAIIGDLNTLESKLEAMEAVTTEAGAATVGEFRAQLNKRVKDLDTERKDMGAGARETLDRLNSKFKVPIERAQRLVQLCDNLLKPYLADQRRIREEAEAAERKRKAEEDAAKEKERLAKEEADRIARTTADKAALKESQAKLDEARAGVDSLRRAPMPTAPKKTVTTSHGSKLGLRKNWKWRVVDLSKVPDEYKLTPDECVKKGELTKIARGQQEMAFVPGIEFYSEDGIATATR